MDVRQLRYFVTVAEELNFSRAAIRLHMSQPPLSQQIKALEDELGTALLIRTRREVKLTDAGKVFLRESRAVLSRLQSAVDVTRRTAKGDIGELRLGMATSAVFNVMPQILERLKDQFPQAEVSVTDMGSRDQIRAVLHDKLDIGLIHEQPHIEGLEFQHIFSESLSLAIPCNHPFANQEHIQLSELKEQPFIAFSRDYAPTLFDSFIAACREGGFSPRIAHTARHAMTIFQMVRLGLGVALVPSSFARSASPGVTYRRMETVTQSVSICAIWHPKNPSNLVHAAVREILAHPIN
ncbi:MAG TPA: LysR substrate-binding domain-containing protein [Eoetvoesiella sp.]